MISSFREYKYYIEADRIALNMQYKKPKLFGDEIWKFQRLLRKLEYVKNCKKYLFWRVIGFLLYRYFDWLSVRLGFTIPLNVFGPGLSIAHRGTIVVNDLVKVGANCRIHTCVNIGTAAGLENRIPTIGDNVYIGPGVKIFGNIVIADNIAIGANSVVNKSFLVPNISIAGAPAREISNKGSYGLLIRATDKLKDN